MRSSNFAALANLRLHSTAHSHEGPRQSEARSNRDHNEDKEALFFDFVSYGVVRAVADLGYLLTPPRNKLSLPALLGQDSCCGFHARPHIED
jgi:hypothetical protein